MTATDAVGPLVTQFGVAKKCAPRPAPRTLAWLWRQNGYARA